MKLKLLVIGLSLLSLFGIALAGEDTSTAVKSGLPTWGTTPGTQPLVDAPARFYGPDRKCGRTLVTRSATGPSGLVCVTQTMYYCSTASSPCLCRSNAWFDISNFPFLRLIGFCTQKSIAPCP